MLAVKGNIEYTIEETEKNVYINNGFDIYKDGKKIADGQGKKVSFAEYKKVKDELEELKAKGTNEKEIEDLKAEIATKDEEITKLNATVVAKDEEIKKLNATISKKDEEIKKLKG